MREQDTEELIQDSKELREQLVRLTARLDGFVEALVATTDDTQQEERDRGER